jgi:hypothetical protein
MTCARQSFPWIASASAASTSSIDNTSPIVVSVHDSSEPSERTMISATGCITSWQRNRRPGVTDGRGRHEAQEKLRPPAQTRRKTHAPKSREVLGDLRISSHWRLCVRMEQVWPDAIRTGEAVRCPRTYLFCLKRRLGRTHQQGLPWGGRQNTDRASCARADQVYSSVRRVYRAQSRFVDYRSIPRQFITIAARRRLPSP